MDRTDPAARRRRVPVYHRRDGCGSGAKRIRRINESLPAGRVRAASRARRLPIETGRAVSYAPRDAHFARSRRRGRTGRRLLARARQMKVFNTLKAVRALLGISAIRVAEAVRRHDGMDVAVEALPRIRACRIAETQFG